jgi:hypothetical protein
MLAGRIQWKRNNICFIDFSIFAFHLSLSDVFVVAVLVLSHITKNIFIADEFFVLIK